MQQAQAALAQAELNLQYTTDQGAGRGIVSRKTVEVGQVVQPASRCSRSCRSSDVWVTANFKETQLTDDAARPARDGRSRRARRQEFNGHVDSIAAATGAKFSLLPPENATGNYVKVVQRVPVKIVLEPGQDPEHLLRPGMSVDADGLYAISRTLNPTLVRTSAEQHRVRSTRGSSRSR